jgi:fatty-acyl-CoA synthase
MTMERESRAAEGQPHADDRPHHRIWPARLPRHLVLPDTSLWTNLEVSALRYPDKAIYRFFGRSLSFGELARQSLAIAGWLQRRADVAGGDRVALVMQNCPQMAAAFYGVLRADAVVVPVNPMNRAEELRHVFADSGARVVFCAADLLPHVIAANALLEPTQGLRDVVVVRYADALPPRADLGPDDGVSAALGDWLYAPTPTITPEVPVRSSLRVHEWSALVAGGDLPRPHAARPDDMALLPYTSGTTGHPKGCIHTHRTLMHNAVGGTQWGHAGPETVALGVVPMFHITGLVYGLLLSVFAGSTVVLMPRWDRELAGRLISRERVSHWTCIPTMVIDLFASPNIQSFDLSSLRYLSGGGAAMPQAVAEKLLAQFGLTFAEGYGLTETAAPSHGNLPERAKLQCLGIPIFGVDSRVVDPVTLEEVPIGDVGEIVTHGPMVFKGYWRHEEATRAAFVTLPGDPSGKPFFRTGDLGRMDEEGYFFITDRLKRMINASGFKVWPAEVEALLYRHPAIQEACIIAARDAYRGETVKAVVVLRLQARGHTTEAEIIDWARDQMAVYKAPRQVEFVEALPKSGSGKVMWRLLQDAEAGKEG